MAENTLHPERINVRVIMHQIRGRIHDRASLDQERGGESAYFSEMDDLREMIGALRVRLDALGELPVQPRTFRGMVGAFLVKAVRRALFWFTPSVRSCLAGVVDALEHQAAALQYLDAVNRENRRILEDLQAGIRTLTAAAGDCSDGSKDPGDSAAGF